jgi:hypothetical protein
MSIQSRPDHRIRPLLERFGVDEDKAITPLDDLKREIYQYGKRRCDVEASRDNLKYYLGFAFEVNQALDIDSLALTGLLTLPAWVVFGIIGEGSRSPVTVLDVLRVALLRPPVIDWAREQGTWLQWKRLEAIYRQEVDDFRASDAFQRPGWRRKSVTRRQHYLIGEIRRILGVESPALATRGQAYDFIASHGGNPRFLTKPPVPAAYEQA